MKQIWMHGEYKEISGKAAASVIPLKLIWDETFKIVKDAVDTN